MSLKKPIKLVSSIHRAYVNTDWHLIPLHFHIFSNQLERNHIDGSKHPYRSFGLSTNHRIRVGRKRDPPLLFHEANCRKCFPIFRLQNSTPIYKEDFRQEILILSEVERRVEGWWWEVQLSDPKRTLMAFNLGLRDHGKELSHRSCTLFHFL